MTTKERIIEIKKQFHSMMNGVVSRSMREKGADYGIIFGVEAPRLVGMAEEIGKNHDLAQALWKENVRECRILAMMIQPYDSFLSEIADIWISSMRNQEEAQYASMYLFQYLPYAESKVFEWIADERDMYQLCGFLTVARLLLKGTQFCPRTENELLDQCRSAIASENKAVSKAAYNNGGANIEGLRQRIVVRIEIRVSCRRKQIKANCNCVPAKSLKRSLHATGRAVHPSVLQF